MRLYSTFSVLAFLLGLSSCNVNLFEEELPFEGCCGIAPVLTSVGEADIYIPNAITPNGDGLNDEFAILVSKPVSILKLSVMEEHEILGIVRSNIDVNAGGKSIWKPVNASGNAILGIYNYELLIADQNGVQDSISGQFCAFSCEETEQFELSECTFSTMHDGNGVIDPSLPSGEMCP